MIVNLHIIVTCYTGSNDVPSVDIGSKIVTKVTARGIEKASGLKQFIFLSKYVPQ